MLCPGQLKTDGEDTVNYDLSSSVLTSVIEENYSHFSSFTLRSVEDTYFSLTEKRPFQFLIFHFVSVHFPLHFWWCLPSCLYTFSDHAPPPTTSPVTCTLRNGYIFPQIFLWHQNYSWSEWRGGNRRPEVSDEWSSGFVTQKIHCLSWMCNSIVHMGVLRIQFQATLYQSPSETLSFTHSIIIFEHQLWTVYWQHRRKKSKKFVNE